MRFRMSKSPFIPKNPPTKRHEKNQPISSNQWIQIQLHKKTTSICQVETYLNLVNPSPSLLQVPFGKTVQFSNCQKRCWNFDRRHFEIQTFRCVSSFFRNFDFRFHWQLLGDSVKRSPVTGASEHILYMCIKM